MNEALPSVYLARHGETAWSLSGQHTGLTDLPLTERGEANARAVGDRCGASLSGWCPRARYRERNAPASSPASVMRQSRTATSSNGITGATKADVPAEILEERPGWQLFRDGCPGGESPADTGSRADRVIARIRAATGNVLVFSSGHILRVLGARWLGLLPGEGRYYFSVPRA